MMVAGQTDGQVNPERVREFYADLGKMTCDAGVCGVETTFRPRINMVRAGVNVRF